MNNSPRQTVIKISWLYILTLTLLPWLAGCANESVPKPPIKLPFEVQKAGSMIEMEIRIVEEKEYRFALVFMYNKGDSADGERVRKLAGEPEVDNIFGKLMKPGVPILLRFKINVIDSIGEKPFVLEREVSELAVTSTGVDHFTKKIAYLPLKQGRYRISVESVKDVPELIGTPVFFQIGFNAKL